ncbi:hypothetical protein LEP1GSC137_0836 [Leptospira borgpetersenii str. Noumea 25]|nr:hypothetical protein LEP1GSC137_0836 [Leptospira borgpetersenii str. Noumea 25]
MIWYEKNSKIKNRIFDLVKYDFWYSSVKTVDLKRCDKFVLSPNG